MRDTAGTGEKRFFSPATSFPALTCHWLSTHTNITQHSRSQWSWGTPNHLHINTCSHGFLPCKATRMTGAVGIKRGIHSPSGIYCAWLSSFIKAVMLGDCRSRNENRNTARKNAAEPVPASQPPYSRHENWPKRRLTAGRRFHRPVLTSCTRGWVPRGRGRQGWDQLLHSTNAASGWEVMWE